MMQLPASVFPRFWFLLLQHYYFVDFKWTNGKKRKLKQIYEILVTNFGTRPAILKEWLGLSPHQSSTGLLVGKVDLGGSCIQNVLTDVTLQGILFTSKIWNMVKNLTNHTSSISHRQSFPWILWFLTRKFD